MLPLKGVLSWLDASTMRTNLRRGSSSTYWTLSPRHQESVPQSDLT